MGINGNRVLESTMYSSRKIQIDDIEDHEKLESIQYHFTKIMEALGLDLDDASLKKTPERVAKMYVNEVFRGLNENNFPKISFFENTNNYKDMLMVDNISMYSYCEHHFVPFFGKVAVAYIPNDRVIGLSKINRIVQFIASKPQIQEKLTVEIGQKLSELLKTDDIAVFIEATHLCVASRGVRDEKSVTKTNFFSGKFLKNKMKSRFINALGK
ncbi:GTP cyclohydrolase I FolE [Gelidibacter japonicus]|uniref:GTP cyclohydrolase I FolE n=1 Tax=Gelidibacter japonicus TaxID=1962232 RepID=UPI001F077FC2|nr:GTP cyclohydrolase I FolE [Gelidibacter japonicus]